MVRLLLLIALAQGTPEPTPIPVATATPDPNKPPGIREDAERTMFVTAAKAPDNFYHDRDRGMVKYDDLVSNYSFQRVVLPITRPLTITGANFTQNLAGTVVFWQVDAVGTNLGAALRTDRVLPDGIAVDVSHTGCWLRLRGVGWTRSMYTITGINGIRWQLDRNASPNANLSGGIWNLICPQKNFDGITFVEANLKNTWLPSVRNPPTLINCQRHQADLPTPTPVPTPTP